MLGRSASVVVGSSRVRLFVASTSHVTPPSEEMNTRALSPPDGSDCRK